MEPCGYDELVESLRNRISSVEEYGIQFGDSMIDHATATFALVNGAGRAGNYLTQQPAVAPPATSETPNPGHLHATEEGKIKLQL